MAESRAHQARREVVRYRVGWALSTPFWWVHRLGERAQRISTHLVDWAEAASPTAFWSRGSGDSGTVAGDG